jgi:hypothetical protein
MGHTFTQSKKTAMRQTRERLFAAIPILRSKRGRAIAPLRARRSWAGPFTDGFGFASIFSSVFLIFYWLFPSNFLFYPIGFFCTLQTLNFFKFECFFKFEHF